MRVVLLGAPASGKGTQATVLQQKFGIPKISTGDMLRSAVSAKTPLGQEARRYMSSGKLVPDAVVIGLVEERIAADDAQKGFVLDGFPRTVAQAEALGATLAKRGLKLDHVIQIDVPRELLVERATQRRHDKQTGQVYHLKYSPPPPGTELEQRADDREETVLRRLEEYDQMTAALLPHYARIGLLCRIDGVGPPEEVTTRLFRHITGSATEA